MKQGKGIDCFWGKIDSVGSVICSCLFAGLRAVAGRFGVVRGVLCVCGQSPASTRHALKLLGRTPDPGSEEMSCNLLNARPVDALSDISESAGTSVSGRTSGWDSREELRDLVTLLGLHAVDDLYQDKFRVDRRKLEHMLLGEYSRTTPPQHTPFNNK